MSREVAFAVVSTVALGIVFAVSIIVGSGATLVLSLLPLFVLFVVTVSNFELAVFLLLGMLFVDVHYASFSSAVWYSLPFGLSFLVRYKGLDWKEFDTPLNRPIFIYGLCVLPSFFNAMLPFVSALALFNVLAFLIAFYAMVISIRRREDLRTLLIFYLVLTALNSFDVLRLVLSANKRVFGFSGIMFVDYSALAVCLAAVIGIISKGKVRALAVLMSVLFAIALVLTRTRNTWFSALITLGITGIYILFHPEIIGVSRRRAFVAIVSIYVLIIGCGAAFILLNRGIEQRATQFSAQTGPAIDESGKVENSFVSRMLIWDTAINAFRAHPVIGIGVYAFPYSSKFYYRIPRFLYTRYVEGLSPHQTHLAVLCETGVVGAIAFFLFIIAALKTAYRGVSRAVEEQSRKDALIAAVAVTYCTVSMIFTDAWLWGQGIVLLGLILGLTVANRNIAMQTE